MKILVRIWIWCVLVGLGMLQVRSAPRADYVDGGDEDGWADFKIRYKKRYDNDVEEYFRKSVFHVNQQKIATHNEKYKLGLYSYKIRMNQFGDMLLSEYENYMHAANRTYTRMRRVPRGEEFARPLNLSRIDLPDLVDWRKRGAVTPVQDQGLICGSCWAFAAIGALEGQYFLKTGVLTALSAQCLLDCTADYGNMGCGGGSAALSFQFVQDHRGLEPAANYSYEGRANICPYNLSTDYDDELTDPSFIYVTYGDETALEVAVATIGPMSAALDGSHDTFRFYSEGMYYQPECDENDLDHAVLIVGYGRDSENRDYWLVKNSWGESWGEAGYFKIPRNRHNHCGIAAAAIYPLV